MARVDTLPQVPFPLPDPGVVLQNLWVTQGGRDWNISPTRLGAIQQSRIAPVNPFFYQLWWDTSALPSGSAVLRAYVDNKWVEVGPFGDENGNVTVPGTLTVTSGVIDGANAQGFLEVGSNLLVDGGTIGGPASGVLTTTSDFNVGRNLTVTGLSTLKGATTVTGGLTTDTLTTSGNATVNGSLTTNTITITSPGSGSTGGFTAASGTFSSFLTVSGVLTANDGINYTGGTTGDTLTLNGTAPQITLSNGTANWVQYGSAGVNPPTIGAHSPGTKLLLSQQASSTSYDVAIGLQFNAMWFTAGGYAFYGMAGSPATMAVDANGNLVISSANWNIAGSAGSTTLNIQFVNAAQQIAAATLASSGNASIGGNLAVAGTGAVGGALTVTGAGSSFVQGLSVTAQAGQNNAITTNGGLGINGASTFNGSTVINPTSGQQDSLLCTGAIECRTTVTGGTAFACRGNAEFDNNVFVGGTLNTTTQAIGTLTVGTAFTVNGTAGFTGAVDIVGATQIGGGLYVAGLVAGAGVSLDVSGSAAISGQLWVAGTQITSDARIKTDITPYHRGLDAISQLRPVSYRMATLEGRHHGLIADEVAEVIPEAVGMYRGLRTIDPMVLIDTLINTVRELGEKVGTMQHELDRLSSSAGERAGDHGRGRPDDP